MLSKKQIRKLAQKIPRIKSKGKKIYAKILMDAIRFRLENYDLERYIPHAHQKEIHTHPAKIRGLYGANRMGKTFCGIKEVCFHATGHYPRWWPDHNKFEPPIEIWCVIEKFSKSQSEKTSSTGSAHGDQIEMNIGPEIERYPTRQKKRYLLNNGSIIHLKTYGQGRESFESDSIPFIYFDEECPEDIYNAGLARTIDCDGRILITLTAVEGAQWFYKLIQRSKDDDDVFTLSEDIYANKSLSEDQIDSVAQQFDGKDKMIRIHGSFVPGAGRPVFDQEAITRYQERADEEDGEEVELVIDFENPRFKKKEEPLEEERETIDVKVWQRPKEDKYYVIGCDPGGTARDSSKSGVHVMSRDSEFVVARISGKPTQLELARALWCLGKIYNTALINVETNKGEAVMGWLQERNYEKLFYRNKELKPGKFEKRAGFYMTRSNRPTVINYLQDRLEREEVGLLCKETIKQLSTFVNTESGKQEAQYGTFDDLVISLALTEYARRQTHDYNRDEVDRFIGDSGNEGQESSGSEIKPEQIGGEESDIIPAK